MDYLTDLHSKASLYMQIVSPQATDWKQADQKQIYNSLLALKVFGVSIMRSFLLSLFTAKSKKRISQNQLIMTLKSIENFHFMFNSICSLRPSGLEGLYAKLARRLNETTNRRDAANIIDELINTLNVKKPTINVFLEKFTMLSFTNNNTHQKKLIQYIFTEFERHYRETNEFEPSDLSLEHILSQATELAYVGNIGNILPLGQDLNGLADTSEFKEKRVIYQTSDYQTVQTFLDSYAVNEFWNEQLISERANELGCLAYNQIWSA